MKKSALFWTLSNRLDPPPPPVGSWTPTKNFAELLKQCLKILNRASNKLNLGKTTPPRSPRLDNVQIEADFFSG